MRGNTGGGEEYGEQDTGKCAAACAQASPGTVPDFGDGVISSSLRRSGNLLPVLLIHKLSTSWCTSTAADAADADAVHRYQYFVCRCAAESADPRAIVTEVMSRDLKPEVAPDIIQVWILGFLSGHKE